MPPVFNRSTPNPHPYDISISELLRLTPGDKALARNIMYDFRVSNIREGNLNNFCQFPLLGTGLRDAIIDYFYNRIRNQATPDYIDASLNADNIVSGIATIRQKIRKDTLLVRIVDLNGLAPVFSWAKSEGIKTFKFFPDPIDDSIVSSWLTKKIEGFTTAQLRDFMKVVIDAMNSMRKIAPFQPTWVTTWEALKPHLAAKPERWLETLGVAKPESPRWMFLLRYTVRDAGTVARPTQLDAGSYPYHFPSPPQASIEWGGHPMDLQISPPAAFLLPEFIHEQIDHRIEHWDEAGQFCIATTRPMVESLDKQRCTHHKLLALKYGRHDIQYWMPECSDLCRNACK
jgi:hypothetical protein